MKISNTPEKDVAVTTQIEANPETLTQRRSLTPKSSGATTPDSTFELQQGKYIFKDIQASDQTWEKLHQVQAIGYYSKYSTPTFITNDVRNGLPTDETRCSLIADRPAIFLVKGTEIKLCALAAEVLTREKVLNAEFLELIPFSQQPQDTGPRDPISGILAATHSTVAGVLMGLADYPVEITKIIEADRDVSASLAKDFALDSGKGISRVVGTALKAPMEYTLNISKGFHNLPEIYGDKVRKEEEVKGVGSGFVAGGKGFGLGLYDGISGIFVQPFQGAKKEGVSGFFKGFGRGIGGAVCKPAAGALGLPGYAFKGIYEEVRSLKGGNQENWKTRIQNEFIVEQIHGGRRECEVLSEEDRKVITGMWRAVKPLGRGWGEDVKGNMEGGEKC